MSGAWANSTISSVFCYFVGEHTYENKLGISIKYGKIVLLDAE